MQRKVIKQQSLTSLFLLVTQNQLQYCNLQLAHHWDGWMDDNVVTIDESLLVSCGDEKDLRLWDKRTGKVVKTLSTSEPVSFHSINRRRMLIPLPIVIHTHTLSSIFNKWLTIWWSRSNEWRYQQMVQ
jgi:WD40 repeat protein